jgi:RNA-directed DNA polymerase
VCQLQQLFALEAMQRAWLAVKRAGGGAGMDGVTITQFEANLTQELRDVAAAVGERGVSPESRCARCGCPRRAAVLRPLALWALRDRVAQRVVYELLAPVFEPHFLPCSFGFRPGLGVQDAVAALQRQRDTGLRWVVDADIEDCFR